jgi:hypothetical protein
VIKVTESKPPQTKTPNDQKPMPPFTTYNCDYCDAECGKMHCHCFSAWYCDSKCQAAHWETHQWECVYHPFNEVVITEQFNINKQDYMELRTPLPGEEVDAIVYPRSIPPPNKPGRSIKIYVPALCEDGDDTTRCWFVRETDRSNFGYGSMTISTNKSRTVMIYTYALEMRDEVMATVDEYIKKGGGVVIKGVNPDTDYVE